MCELVLKETGLLPHANPGVLTRDQLLELRMVTASQGIMLETVADRLSERGMPHYGSPDKLPASRLETLRLAGELAVPFTTGILIGIGETRAERVRALRAIAALHEAHGHIQEVIVQNFRAKPGTKMADAPEPAFDELLWTTAVARVILPPEISLQVPPNLSASEFPGLLDAGINDWGGVSPVTIDHVNPEAPWPALQVLRAATESRGYRLAARVPCIRRTWPTLIAGANPPSPAPCAPTSILRALAVRTASSPVSQPRLQTKTRHRVRSEPQLARGVGNSDQVSP